ncbi:MAG: hypothetical protein ACI8T1_002715 [Verrucomicrobiales bacterium]|jgi:hypothetical protein
MKRLPLLLLVLGAFSLGMWVERQLKPNQSVAAPSPTLSTRSILPISEQAVANAQPNQEKEDQHTRHTEKRSLAQLLDLSGKREDMHRALAPFSSDEIPHLLNELRKLENDDPRARPLKQVLYERWARADPAKALESVLQEKNARLQSHVIHNAFSKLAEQDLGLATSAFSQLQTRRQREEAVSAMAHNADLSELPVLSEFLATQGSSAYDHPLYHNWVERDPLSAAAFAQGSSQNGNVMRAIGESWSQQDPTAALEWAQSLDSQNHGARALAGVLNGLAHHDPAAAASIVSQTSLGTESNEFVREIAHQWAREDVASALAWTETLSGRDQVKAIEAVAHTWARQDPQSAADWVQSMSPDSEANRHAIGSVASEWAEVDSLAASEWIGSLPAGATRDMAAERLVDRITTSNPDAAFQWAMSASDVEHQTNMMHHVLAQWNESDPQAAQATFEAATLTGEQRERLNQVFQQPN